MVYRGQSTETYRVPERFKHSLFPQAVVGIGARPMLAVFILRDGVLLGGCRCGPIVFRRGNSIGDFAGDPSAAVKYPTTPAPSKPVRALYRQYQCISRGIV
jgi:hypothetical protein